MCRPCRQVEYAPSLTILLRILVLERGGDETGYSATLSTELKDCALSRLYIKTLLFLTCADLVQYVI